MPEGKALNQGRLLSIGEAARAVGVEIHTIRFWSEEFSNYITFKLGKGGRRYYGDEAIETLKQINRLIHIEGIRIKSIKEKHLLLGRQDDEGNYLSELESAISLLSQAKRLLAG